MIVLNRLVIFFVLGILAATSPLTNGQVIGQTTEGDFSISTKVSLGTSGFSMSTDFKLVDDIGFEYDVMSLIRNQTVKEMTGVRDEQVEALQDIWQHAKSEMNSKVVKLIAFDENREEIRQIFMDAQDELLEQLDPVQVDRLHQVRDYVAIQKYGVATYLGSKRVRNELGLTDEQLEPLGDAESAFKGRYEESVGLLTVEANEALINELTETQHQAISDLFNEVDFKTYFETKLFTDQNSLRGKPACNQAFLLGVTRSRRIRTECDIDESQYKSIKQLKRQTRKLDDEEIAERLNEILRPDQIKRLGKIAILDQAKNVGTTNVLTYGLLGESLDLTAEESEALYETGEQLQRELETASSAARNDALRASMTLLNAQQQSRVLEMFEVVK